MADRRNPLHGGHDDDDKKPLASHGEEREEEVATEFVYSHGISSNEAKRLIEVHGKNELPEVKIPKWYIFASQLWQPMPIMIWLAAIVEAGISNFLDMGILLMIQFANASIGYYEITKAGDAVAALKKSLKPVATVKRDGVFVNIDATLVVPGDLVLLASGSAIPADCRVNEGEIEVDEAALTGESLPVTKFQGSSCKMGSTVVRGEVEGTVEFTGANTFFGKTAALLGGTNESSNFQKLLVEIVMVLVVLSSALCLIVFIYLLTLTSFTEALSFTVVLMVASIPIAIEIVTTTTLALGSKELSHEGAIVTRLAAIEDMAGMSILCSDKTGTLTMNKMQIQKETPVYKQGETQYTLLRYAAMAAKWKEPPRDALDTLTLTAVDMPSMDAVVQQAFMPFDPIVKRTEGTVKEVATGKTYKTSKGAPHVILQLVCAGTTNQAAIDAITHAVERDVESFGLRGIRTLAVAKTNERNEWEFLGMLTFLDPPRPDTKQTIDDAIKYGVAVKMITGDHLLIARETARVLGMGDYVKTGSSLPLLDPVTKKKPPNLSALYGDQCLAVDGFAQVFPEHKYLIVECLRELGYKTGMTGDGVNDAPALKRADVGVAVHGSTDAARAAADIVLTQPGLSTIVNGILISRRIFVRIKNFLTYRIAATLQLLVFFFISVLCFKPVDFMPSDWETRSDFPDSQTWPDFFHLPVLMLMLITLLNDGTLIAIGYDRVTARQTPEKWNLPVLYLISSVLAGVACLSSLILLYIMLNSWNSGAFGGLSYGQITTAIYLKVSISDFLTLFSARTNEDWFWTTAPAPILGAAGCLALTISTIIACSWPSSYPDGVYTLGLSQRIPYGMPVYIWLYCIGWWFVQDAAKVFTFYLLKKHNYFGYNDTGKLVLPQSTLDYIQEHKDKDMKSNKGGH
ncbi:P3A, P type ATPase [Ochromonadaceae sp. CCMP2298]|nr:P3A, P type ATPase [Ochromonadaceae sp. CCMP2298]